MKLRVSQLSRIDRGFSLIETVIAIGLLGIIAVALVSALATGIKVLSMTDIRETARDLAERQMESVQRQPYDAAHNPPVYQALVGAPADFTITLTPTRLDRGGGTDNDTGIQHVTISVKKGTKPIFELEGQKVP